MSSKWQALRDFLNINYKTIKKNNSSSIKAGVSDGNYRQLTSTLRLGTVQIHIPGIRCRYPTVLFPVLRFICTNKKSNFRPN